MKKMFCLVLAALTLLLAGCGVSDQEVVDSIPSMIVQSGNIPAQVPAYSYSWTVTDRLGNGASVIADTAHPLEAREDLTTVTLTAGGEVSLHFSRTPDSVTVTYWSAQETDYENGTQLSTTFLDDAFHFTAPETQGQQVYSVTALWSSYDDVSGSVTYAFRTAA